MRPKSKILVLLILTSFAVAATTYASASQIILQEAKAQGKPTLLSGELTAPSNGKPFGGENIGSYAITPSGHKVDITIHINKPPRYGQVFEAWLVDTKTGYDLSLGQVGTDGKVTLSQNMFNPYAYNQIIISQESPNSTSHKPSLPIGGAALEAPFGA